MKGIGARPVETKSPGESIEEFDLFLGVETHRHQGKRVDLISHVTRDSGEEAFQIEGRGELIAKVLDLVLRKLAHFPEDRGPLRLIDSAVAFGGITHRFDEDFGLLLSFLRSCRGLAASDEETEEIAAPNRRIDPAKDRRKPAPAGPGRSAQNRTKHSSQSAAPVALAA